MAVTRPITATTAHTSWHGWWLPASAKRMRHLQVILPATSYPMRWSWTRETRTHPNTSTWPTNTSRERMSGNSFSRREFIAAGLSGTAAASLASTAAAASPLRGAGEATPPIALTNPGPGTWARWLGGHAPAINTGVTWGVPWPRGKHSGPKFAAGHEVNTARHFSLREPDGPLIPLQSWPLAYWPDGSLKWTAHALPVDAKMGAGPWEIVAV